MGITQIPAPIANAALKAGKLKQVLDDFAPSAPGMFLYYPSRHQMLPKLRAFVDHVQSRSAAIKRSLRASRENPKRERASV